MPEADDVAVRVLLEEQRRDRKQRVEPSPRLVDGLGNEIGRERLLEQLLVLARIPALGEWHRARVEPGVEDLRDPAHHTAALLARQRDLVDVGPVQIVLVREAELGRRADDALVAATLADP